MEHGGIFIQPRIVVSAGHMIGMRKRYGRKTDSNQKDIVKALKKIGCNVFDIEEPFDLLIDYRGEWRVLEVKNPETHARKKGGSKMTDKQDALLALISAPVLIAETIEEAIRVVTESYK